MSRGATSVPHTGLIKYPNGKTCDGAGIGGGKRSTDPIVVSVDRGRVAPKVVRWLDVCSPAAGLSTDVARDDSNRPTKLTVLVVVVGAVDTVDNRSFSSSEVFC